jgi:hypothetical protein
MKRLQGKDFEDNPAFKYQTQANKKPFHFERVLFQNGRFSYFEIPYSSIFR